MKKLVCLFGLLGLLTLSSCLREMDDTSEYQKAVSKGVYELPKFAHVVDTNDANSTSSVSCTLYRFKKSKVYYVSLETFFNLEHEIHFRGFRNYDVSYTVSKNSDNLFKVTRENGATLFVNTEENTIKSSNIDLFNAASNSALDVFGEGYNFKDITDTDIRFLAKSKDSVTNQPEKEFELDLDSYYMDIVEYSDKAYIPFQTMSDIFLSPLSYGMTVLSNGIYCPQLQTSFDSYKEGQYVYLKELRTFNYYETCLLLDVNYGLKSNKDRLKITSFDEYFKSKGYDKLMKKSIKSCEMALIKFLINDLDDLHSSYLISSSLLGYSDMYDIYKSADYGARYTKYIEIQDEIKNASEYYDRGSDEYHFYKDTAILVLDSFDALDESLYEEEKEEVKSDDIWDWFKSSKDSNTKLINNFFTALLSKGEAIKNIVIDLSANSGGNLDLGVYLAGILTDEVDLIVKNQSTGLVSHTYYKSDLNLDGVIDSNDSKISSGNYNIYIATSGCTFSCANLVASLTKGHDNIKIIGKQSSGGECSVLITSNSFGTIFSISSIYSLGMVINNEVVGVDSGIEVDYEFDYETLYNYELLTNELKRLNELKQN